MRYLVEKGERIVAYFGEVVLVDVGRLIYYIIYRVEIKLIGHESVVRARIQHGRIVGIESGHAVCQIGKNGDAQQVVNGGRNVDHAGEFVYDSVDAVACEVAVAHLDHYGHTVKIGIVIVGSVVNILDVVAHALIIGIVVAEHHYERIVGKPVGFEVVEHDAYSFVEVHARRAIVSERRRVLVVFHLGQYAARIENGVVRLEVLAVSVLPVLRYRRYVRVEPAVGGEHELFARLEHFRIEVAFADAARARVVRYVHILARREACEAERRRVVLFAVVERSESVVEGIAFHAEQIFHHVGHAVRNGIVGIRIVDVFVQRIITYYALVFGNVRLFERVRVIEYRGGIALVYFVKIGVERAKNGGYLLRRVEQYGLCLQSGAHRRRFYLARYGLARAQPRRLDLEGIALVEIVGGVVQRAHLVAVGVVKRERYGYARLGLGLSVVVQSIVFRLALYYHAVRAVFGHVGYFDVGQLQLYLFGVAVGITRFVAQECEPLEAFAQYRHDVVVGRLAVHVGRGGGVSVDVRFEFLGVAAVDLREPHAAGELVGEVAYNALVGIRARFGLVELVAQVVGVVVVVGEEYEQRVAFHDERQEHRHYRVYVFVAGAEGHALHQDPTDHSVQRYNDDRHEHECEIDGYAFEYHHRVGAQVYHGVIENRAVAVEHDDEQQVDQKVDDQCRQENGVARFVPGQERRDYAHEPQEREKQPRLGHVEFARRDCYARKLYEQRRCDVAEHEVVAHCEFFDRDAHRLEFLFYLFFRDLHNIMMATDAQYET